MTEDCTHEITVIVRLDDCEIDEDDRIAHTSILVLGCTRCKRVEYFPAQNAALLTVRYRGFLRADLTRQGWIVPEKETGVNGRAFLIDRRALREGGAAFLWDCCERFRALVIPRKPDDDLVLVWRSDYQPRKGESA